MVGSDIGKVLVKLCKVPTFNLQKNMEVATSKFWVIQDGKELPTSIGLMESVEDRLPLCIATSCYIYIGSFLQHRRYLLCHKINLYRKPNYLYFLSYIIFASGFPLEPFHVAIYFILEVLYRIEIMRLWWMSNHLKFLYQLTTNLKHSIKYAQDCCPARKECYLFLNVECIWYIYKFYIQNVIILKCIYNPFKVMKFANSFLTHTTSNHYTFSCLFHNKLHILV